MTRNDLTAAAFTAHPEATVIITSVSHAYGRARYNGRCKLTGAVIHSGDKTRTIEGVCRSGQAFKVVIPSAARDSVLSTMESGWRREIQTEGPKGHLTLYVFSWSRCDSAWVDSVAERIETAEPSAQVRLAEPNMCGGLSVTNYTKQANGKWRRAGTYRDSTTKALLGSLRRSKRYTIWQVVGA